MPTRLIESNMPILTDTAQEQFDPTDRFDAVFVSFAFAEQVFDGSVKDIYLRRRNINWVNRGFVSE
jgi:hypothetical protein